MRGFVQGSNDRVYAVSEQGSDMGQAAQEKILVIGPSWVGDMVMAQSLFMCLKQQYPACQISVMAPDWTLPLLHRMPEVDASMPSELGHGELKLGLRRAIGRRLRGSFDRAIVLPNSLKSALIPFHAGIPRRTGWRGEWRQVLLNDCRVLNKEAFPLMVQRFAALAYPPADTPPAHIPYPRLQAREDSREELKERFKLKLEKPVLAICAGAEFGIAKQWPAHHYAELVNALVDTGWQVWFFGSANDQLITESILADVETSHLDHCFNLAGATSLAEAIDLLSCADAVVSNDSGLMHVAAALGKPVTGIYGSTSADFTPPLSERVKLLHTDIECRPCFKRECPYGHMRCLTELSPELAIAAVKELTSS